MAHQPKRSRLDGLYFARKHESKAKVQPLETRECYVKELPLNSGDVNREGVLEFELKLGLNEWGRFQPAPFLAEYYFYIKNPEYHEPPADGSPKAKDEPTVSSYITEGDEDYSYVKKPVLMVSSMAPNANMYLPPELGLGALFSHVEVFINGMKVGDDTDMMNQNKAYQALNRIYATKVQRTRVNQDVVDTSDLDGIYGAQHAFTKKEKKKKKKKKAATESEETAGAEASASSSATAEVSELDSEMANYDYKIETVLTEKQSKLIATMSNEGYKEKRPLSTRFTLDGNFAVSPPFCNALATLRKQQDSNVCGFFPPGTVITVRLHPRYPRFAMVQKLQSSHEDMFLKSSLDESKTNRPKDLSVKFTKFVMGYESVVLSDDLSRRQLSKTLNYPFNRVQLDLCTFESKHQQVVVKSRVPAGAKCVYLAFMKEEHLWYNSGCNKNMANYFYFPKDLKAVNLHLPNHGPLLSKNGLTDLNRLDRHYSTSLASYYESYIAGKELTDLPFATMFPTATATQGHKWSSKIQSLFIDLQQYYIKEHTQMSLSFDFEGDLSPEKTKLLLVYAMDVNLRRNPDGRWVLESVI